MSQDCKKITISSIANTIFSNNDKDDYSWFLWPPDVFALISIIFQRTGVYKFCLHESKFWKDLEYDQKKNDFTTPFTKMILTTNITFHI